MQNKQKFIGIITSTVASTLLVALAVYATSTIGDDITVGDDLTVNGDIILQNGETIDNATDGTFAFVSDAGAVTVEIHGLDVTSTGTLSGSGALVGVNSVVTTAGADGDWASGVYGKVIQGVTGDVTGYISGGEFEVDDNSSPVSSAVFPLVLDGNSVNWGGTSAYIMMQDFGAALIPNLVNIQGATTGATNMFYAHSYSPTFVGSLRIIVGTTTYYIPLASDR